MQQQRQKCWVTLTELGSTMGWQLEQRAAAKWEHAAAAGMMQGQSWEGLRRAMSRVLGCGCVWMRMG